MWLLSATYVAIVVQAYITVCRPPNVAVFSPILAIVVQTLHLQYTQPL
jgi:hypothetical protein